MTVQSHDMSQVVPFGDNNLVVSLVVRVDGTFDYRYAQGLNHQRTADMLQDVADRIRAGAVVQDPW